MGSTWLKLWKRSLAISLAALCFFSLSQSRGSERQSRQALSISTLTNLTYEQKLGTQVALDLRFQDEAGRDVELSQYFGRKPVLLALGYYECPMLCNLVLNGLVESLQNLKPSSGKDFEVVFVSIDAAETSALSSAKKQTYIKRYGRPGADASWHFLTGHDDAIRKLTQQVGFHYAYDPAIKQYAHPSGIVVLTPQGKVSRYFFGVSYAPKQLHTALNQAASNQTGSIAQQLLMLCFRHMPLTGKHSAALMVSIRVLAVMTLLGLTCFILMAVRRSSRQPPESRRSETPMPGL